MSSRVNAKISLNCKILVLSPIRDSNNALKWRLQSVPFTINGSSSSLSAGRFRGKEGTNGFWLKQSWHLAVQSRRYLTENVRSVILRVTLKAKNNIPSECCLTAVSPPARILAPLRGRVVAFGGNLSWLPTPESSRL